MCEKERPLTPRERMALFGKRSLERWDEAEAREPRRPPGRSLHDPLEWTMMSSKERFATFLARTSATRR